MSGRVCRFVTGNRAKFREAEEILRDAGVELLALDVPSVEIQADTSEEVAEAKAESVYQEVEPPYFVEDAGVYVSSLNGFPGPYSSYMYKTVGLAGVLQLLRGSAERSAYFLSAVGYVGVEGGDVEVLAGRVDGTISKETRGTGGFGYDPIFKPAEGGGKTFAQMTREEKNSLSHRARALRKLGDHMADRGS